MTTWPPPQPGTHEADLYRNCIIDYFHDDNDNAGEGWTDEQNREFSNARYWSLRQQEQSA